MKIGDLTDAALADVSQILKALADPTRLKIMRCLHGGERSVSEVVAATDGLQANISKHLRVLSQAGLVKSRREAINVYYRVADPCVDRICVAVCDGYAKLMRDKFKKISNRSSRPFRTLVN